MFELFAQANKFRLAARTLLISYVSVVIIMTGKSLLAFPAFPVIG